jgi:putative acetyltransferase
MIESMDSMKVVLSDDFRIRPATNGDQQRILRLIEGILAEFGLRPDLTSSESDLNDIEGTYFKSGGRFELVEDQDGTLIGTYGVLRLDRHTCKLRKMYLVPGLRGLGIGRRMLDRAVAHAKELGCQTVILETVSSMEEAIRLYRRSGFRPIASEAESPRCDQVYSLDLGR